MRSIILLTVMLASMSVVTASAQQPTVNPESWPAITSAVEKDPAVEKRVEEILASMSLEDKVGQIMQPEIRETTPEEVRKYRFGSVLNGGGGFPNNEKYSSVDDWVALADAFYEASMDTSDGGVAIPIIWGVDAVHGHNNVIGATLFPHNIGLGAANNPELLRRIGEVTAREVRATGLDWNFGPTVAVPRDDRWGRTYEGYSEDPDIVKAYAGMMVEGLQGLAKDDDFLGKHRVISTAKHFLGDGGTVGGKDQGDNVSSEAEMRDIHGAGYTTALASGVQVVMASFNSWHGRKLHGHDELLTDVLKDQMGFDGFVVGDWNGHGQVKGCTNKSCAASFNAGVDMFMVPADAVDLYKNTLKQVKKGEIKMARLDDAVRRILRVKVRAGLFEAGKPSSRPLAGDESVIGAPEHREVARQAVRESLVLLKNNGGVLPIDPRKTILVAGDGADDIGKQSGGWTISWQGTGNVKSDFPGGTSIWDGIEATVKAAGGNAVLSVDGSYSKKPDVAIVVFGENPYAEFQGDRKDLDYPGNELKLLKKLKADGIPVVSVFISGRPLWVNPELNASDAFVAAWLPGSEGNGVAQVLLAKADGSVNHDFKGKLSYSWPKLASQFLLNRHDENYDPLFAYGYGLTYAEKGVDLAALSEKLDIETGVDSRINYFAGAPVTPWRLNIGNGDNSSVMVDTAFIETDEVSVSSVDRRVQEDAKGVVFKGSGKGSVYLQTFEPVDISRESNGALALAIDLKMEEMPTEAVMFAMGGVDVDITDILKGLPANEWTRIRIRLSCMEKKGTDMANLDMPFRISTKGKMAFSFSDILLVTEADGEIHCP